MDLVMSGSISKVDGILQKVIGNHQRIVAGLLIIGTVVIGYLLWCKYKKPAVPTTPEKFAMPTSTMRKAEFGMSGSENYMKERAEPNRDVQASARGVDAAHESVYKTTSSSSAAVLASPELACSGRKPPMQDAWQYMTDVAKGSENFQNDLAVNRVSDNKLSKLLMGG
jgi:hypothetical protein